MTSRAVVRELADADGHDEVTEGHDGVERFGEQDPVVEEPEQVVVALGSVLDRQLDRLLDALAQRVVADRDRRHALVQADDERVEAEPDRDDPETTDRDIGEAEGKDERVRHHEQAVPDGVDLISIKVYELERDLDRNAGDEQPHPGDLQPSELPEVTPGDDDEQHRGSDRYHQEPHEHTLAGTSIEVVPTMPRWPSSSTARRRESRASRSIDRSGAMHCRRMCSTGCATRVRTARVDDDVRVVVLTGAGDAAFCAGADLGTMVSDAGAIAAHDGRGVFADLLRDLWALGKPTIARVRGYALAGGFGLAMACDFVVAAEDAQFGTPEINVGLWPYMITVPLLRAMPARLALDLMMTGRRIDANEAARLGIVSRVTRVDELDRTVDELAEELAARSPVAMRIGRNSFFRALEMHADEALDYLQSQLTVTSLSDDTAEGVQAFVEKREPRWRGR